MLKKYKITVLRVSRCKGDVAQPMLCAYNLLSLPIHTGSTSKKIVSPFE